MSKAKPRQSKRDPKLLPTSGGANPSELEAAMKKFLKYGMTPAEMKGLDLLLHQFMGEADI